MLLFHQHVKASILSEQADGLAVGEALLAAGAMLLAVLADLQVARKINNLAGQRHDLSGLGLPVDRGPDGGGRPGLRGLLAQATRRLAIASGIHRHFRVQNGAALF